jgi:hypothetical protein
MDIHHLVKMANSIGDFFQSEPDKGKAAQSVRQSHPQFLGTSHAAADLLPH